MDISYGSSTVHDAEQGWKFWFSRTSVLINSCHVLSASTQVKPCLSHPRYHSSSLIGFLVSKIDIFKLFCIPLKVATLIIFYFLDILLVKKPNNTTRFLSEHSIYSHLKPLPTSQLSLWFFHCYQSHLLAFQAHFKFRQFFFPKIQLITLFHFLKP